MRSPKSIDPVSDWLDRIAGPVSLLIVFGALLVLVWAAYSVSLDRDLASLPEPVDRARVSDTVDLALQVFDADPATTRRMAVTVAAEAVLHVRGVDATMRREAYSVLLRVGGRRDAVVDRFLSVARFGRVRGKTMIGLEQAAQETFGVSADSLSLGEALVLVDRALHAPGAETALDRAGVIGSRNSLIGRALQMGLIDRTRHDVEVGRPLSSATDHRPIW